MADVWHIEPQWPLPGTRCTIRDENGLWVAECIAEDAPVIAEARVMEAVVRQLHEGDTTPAAIDRLLAQCRAIIARIEGRA